MRILFVTPYIPRVRPFNFIRELSKRHDVSLLCLYASEQEKNDSNFEALVHYCRTVRAIKLNSRQSIYNCLLALLSKTPLQVAYCRSPALIKELKELQRDNDFDLIHVEFVRAAYLIDYMDRDVPVIYDCVDSRTVYLEQLFATRKNIYSKALAFEELIKMKRYEPYICKKYDDVFVISNEDANALNGQDSNIKPKVICNGVDLNCFEPAVNSYQEDSIIFHGRMNYYPNTDAVLSFYKSIFPFVRAEKPNIRFYIVGMYPNRKIQELDRDPNIVVTGYVNNVRPFLKQAAVAVCPIRIGVGVQNKILEAMATALPVVTTSLGAEGLSAIPGRDLLVADDPREFAEFVTRLMTDREMRQQVGLSGRKYVEMNHSWERIGQQLESAYEELVEAKRKRSLLGNDGYNVQAANKKIGKIKLTSYYK